MRRLHFTPFWIALLAGLCSGLLAAPGIDPDVRKEVAGNGSARVCVTFEAAPVPESGVIISGEDPPGAIPGAASRLGARRKSFAAAVDRALPALEGNGLRLRHRFTWSPVVVVDVTGEEGLASLAALPGLGTASLDVRGTGGLLESRALVHANEAFELGATGAGATVAVLDSGVDATHPDLAGAVVHEFHALEQGDDVGPGAVDDHGHGTHVTGIIASRGNVAPRGIAPGAQVVAIKVLDHENVGFVSDWARGIEHVIDLHESGTPRIDAVNMSLTTFVDFPGACEDSFPAFSEACAAAQELGISVFAASGNKASVTNLTAPACFASVFSVASVLDTAPETISTFSSRNSRLDLLAPGETITSCWKGGSTFSVKGTSQSTPHAAALACLLREREPSATPLEILDVLRKTGVPIHDAGSQLTVPRIDALAAISVMKDCDSNGIWDWRELQWADCNDNLALDSCDITSGASRDENLDGVPDECGTTFHRGDANSSGDFDLSDAVFIFTHLFSGGRAPACLEAADANNDAELNITDGISLLEFLFLGGTAPPPPGPPGGPCGPDPDAPGSPGDLGCALYERC